MKPVLMIHEIEEKFFDLPLENYILTFDDGLYSQYHHFSKIKKIPTQKIFFISSGIISKGHQNTNFPSSEIAHKKAFSGNFEDFMNLDQIKELMGDPMVSIGGHGHYHKNLKEFVRFTDKLMYIMEDTKIMINWFNENLDFRPTKFCFPYNDDNNGTYRPILEKMGFKEFYGSERISIESLFDQRKD